MKIEELPLGVQTFEELRTTNCIYVDKTDLVYKLANEFKFNFLSRPRRFGKSLLVTTLQSYFQGCQDLFKGLKIESMEKHWIKYPVFRFDLNYTEVLDKDGVYEVINSQLKPYEKEYGIVPTSTKIGIRFSELIREAYNQTKQKVVILIDEYEKPILGTLDEPELQKYHRGYLKSFYGVLKSYEHNIRFALLTGVTKMGHLSVFSDLNNLRNQSLNPDYATLCGFTESEIENYFSEYILEFCRINNWSKEEAIHQLRKKYDGYRFSKEDVKVYNPYSLLNCFADRMLTDYWFESGTPSFLVNILRCRRLELENLEGKEVGRRLLTEIDDEYSDPIPLLYQSGYLTIVDYKHLGIDELFTLNYPNEEVRRGFYGSVLENYTQTAFSKIDSTLKIIVKDAQSGNAKDIMEQISSLITSVPSSPREKYEYFFRDSIYLIFKLLGFVTQCEVHMLKGRIDCVMEAADFIYIFEFKVNKSAKTALNQINDKGYFTPYNGRGKKLIKIGANFSTRSKKITSLIEP